ncbi:hypothetical protein HOU02_gp312 [Caulobacter phage CcrBL9]|uniref:Uncharacterized protein n=1 Tax=Caulobacter phage CcrBL9 TaxID=2283270 RepID=A0A385ECA9_9CAUD|nr:hypothetical protein HOU02_gp312 [Caulobacter phage CcrBL9]AXQ69413.1 hypothetical protein CcrBL9_gp389 [Caulobacter phage CcrBL9]
MMEDSPLWKAIGLWEEITGVAVPNADGSFKGTLGEYDIRQTYIELRETLELDPTEVTTNLIFNTFVKQWMAKQQNSLLDLFNDPVKYEQKLEKPRLLMSILNRPEIIEARDAFLASLNELTVRYGADQRADLQKTLVQYDLLAFLRRDALRASARLRIHQFTSGAPEAADYKPVFVKTVHQWWNINSLLEAALRMPSGISLNLIRDPDMFQSFFCFCIRNGGNLFILTDAPENAHPLQGLFRRKPERAYEARVSKSWFPYDLMNLEWDEETERYFQAESTVTALATYQNQHLPLKPFNELDPAEFLWCSMMLDLIVEKFWRQNYQHPSLSYTGEMLIIENRLETSAASAGLPVAAYQPLNLPALSAADMKTDRLDEAAIGLSYHKPNLWLEERFGHKVQDAALNLVADTSQLILMDKSTGEITTEGREFIKKYEAIPSVFTDRKAQMMAGRVKMQVLNPTRFGTREELDNDRKFIARYNYATEIGRMAHEEFAARKDAIKAWWKKAVEKNRDNLLAYAAAESVWVWSDMKGSGDTFDHMRSGAGPRYRVDLGQGDQGGFRSRRYKDAHKFTHRVPMEKFDYSTLGFEWVNLGDYEHKRRYLCAINETKASFMQCFHPTNADELAILAGCTVEELPDVLQHWTLADPYDGNHLLSRIDPLNWNVKNPWLSLSFRVGIPLSMRGAAKIAPMARKPAIPNIIPDDLIVDDRPSFPSPFRTEQ